MQEIRELTALNEKLYFIAIFIGLFILYRLFIVWRRNIFSIKNALLFAGIPFLIIALISPLVIHIWVSMDSENGFLLWNLTTILILMTTSMILGWQIRKLKKDNTPTT